MSGVPTRLTYKDSSDEEVVIGSMLTGENDNITTCTIKDSSKEWNKVVIEGNQSLEDRLPVSESEYGTARNGEDEPEILVEVFRNGDWEVRDRVYATDGGQTDDRGFYKNNHLYGHGKYTGEQRVEITNPITGDISDGMEALLPNGYSLEVPDDVSIPSLTDYTYKGRRENGYLDLAEPHDWVLVFTAELDSNDDYIVRFEPKGYGDVEGTIIRGIDPFSYDYWKKKDTKTVVSEVTVLGNNPSGETVEVTVTADNPDIKRSQTIRVGYPVTESEAEEIGEDLLQPGFVEHGALEGPLFVDNTVNFSVGIVDDSRGIDDVFTVAEQRDYLHQGETYFSFVFEHEENVRENFMRKGVREERDALFTSGNTDVGGQNGLTEQVDDRYDEFGGDNHPHNVSGKESNQEFQDSDYTTEITTDLGVPDGFTRSIDVTVPSLSSVNDNTFISFHFSSEESGEWRIEIENINTSTTLFDETFNLDYVAQSLGLTVVDSNAVVGDEIRMTIHNNTGSNASNVVSAALAADSISAHSHFIADESDRASDNSTGGDTDVNSLYETLDVETAEKLIEIAQQFKSDRE